MMQLVAASLLASGLGLSPVAAQSTGAMLALYLNGTALEDSVEFSFERTGCDGVVHVTHRVAERGQRYTRTAFQFADLDLEGYRIAETDGGSFAQLMIDPRDGVEGFDFHARLETENAATRANWAEQGATCDDTSCTHEMLFSTLTLVVAGPNAGPRVDFVLGDLRRLKTECTSNQEGNN